MIFFFFWLDGLKHLLDMIEGLAFLFLWNELVLQLHYQDKSVGPESPPAERSVKSPHLIKVYLSFACSALWLWK